MWVISFSFSKIIRNFNPNFHTMNKYLNIALLFLILSCKSQKTIINSPVQQLTIESAEKLIKLPLKCITQEYPNKLGQVLNSDAELKSPAELHPVFYGCFDWHSAVHGHWSLVKLLKEFPDLKEADSVKDILKKRITAEKIKGELAYFDFENNHNYERTYGWAWLLKLVEELHTWDDPLARELENNLLPLSRMISGKLSKYLVKLHYPIRVGTHGNTAFAMTFAYDYALALNDIELKQTIEKRSRDFFYKDANCPINWEPSGHDFLSPCLEEVDLMRRVLPRDEFLKWVKAFLPELSKDDFYLQPGIVSDRNDGHLVHLDGLNFSRAWVFYGLAKQYPEMQHLKKLADKHIQYSLPNLVGDSYEGGHWLASFAIYALTR